MKRTGICPKCNSQKVGYLENIIHRTEGQAAELPVRGHCAAPLGVGESVSGGFIKVTIESPVGQLEAYFCASCGFYETYVKEPDSIPFESITGFKWK